MKILVVGSGGREHALCWKLAQSARRPTIYCAPGNAGTATIARNVPIAAEDIDGLLAFARREAVELTVVGPEDPLCAGIADRFNEAGLRIFGPCAAAARLEGDKAYAKQLMRQAGVPTPEARGIRPHQAGTGSDSASRQGQGRGLFRGFSEAATTWPGNMWLRETRVSW